MGITCDARAAPRRLVHPPLAERRAAPARRASVELRRSPSAPTPIETKVERLQERIVRIQLPRQLHQPRPLFLLPLVDQGMAEVRVVPRGQRVELDRLLEVLVLARVEAGELVVRLRARAAGVRSPSAAGSSP
jgi:hypothetical protein